MVHFHLQIGDGMKGKSLNEKPTFVIHSSDMRGEQKTVYGHDRFQVLNQMFKKSYDLYFLFSSTPFRNNSSCYSFEHKSFRKMGYKDVDLYLTGIVGKLFKWKPEHTLRAVKLFKSHNPDSRIYSLDMGGLIDRNSLISAGADNILKIPTLDAIVYNGTCCIDAEHPLRMAGSIAQGNINNALSNNSSLYRKHYK